MILDELKRGIFTENPVLILLLGLCPSLAITTSVQNGLCMGVAVLFVLIGSNVVVSIIRNAIPQKARIPSFVLIIATFVTIVQLLLKSYLPSLDKSLGIYVPLIVVNCIILGRADIYASRNTPGSAFLDGIGIGLGFTLVVGVASMVRELLGHNTIAGLKVIPGFSPMHIFLLAPGGFFTIALLMVLSRYIAGMRRYRNKS